MVFESFGFKHGIAKDADFVFDARFLPNPHWITELKPLTGLDEPVQRYLLSQPDVVKYTNQLISLLETWLPQLERNNRSYVTVAIGCTGGQHRSVFIAEQLANHFLVLGKTYSAATAHWRNSMPRVENQVSVINKLGLHARAAIKLVQLVANFKAKITLCNGENRVVPTAWWAC